MKIITKCWTPEWFEAVTHAVLDVDIEFLENLAQKIHIANGMKLDDPEFTGLEYDRYDPLFVRVDEAADIQMTENDFGRLYDGGWHILPASMDNHEWDATNMAPCRIRVMAGEIVLDNKFQPTKNIRDNSGRVYWYGFDRHGNSECRAETESFDPQDLQELKKILQEKANAKEV